MAQILAKSLKLAMVMSRLLMTSALRRNGSLMRKIMLDARARSIRADSMTSTGMPASAALRSRKKNGVITQMLVSMTAGIASEDTLSHEIGVLIAPIDSSTALMAPPFCRYI